MHLEPAVGLQIGGGRGQSVIQGLLIELLYASKKWGGGVNYPLPCNHPTALASDKSGIPSYSQNGSDFKPKKDTF